MTVLVPAAIALAALGASDAYGLRSNVTWTDQGTFPVTASASRVDASDSDSPSYSDATSQADGVDISLDLIPFRHGGVVYIHIDSASAAAQSSCGADETIRSATSIPIAISFSGTEGFSRIEADQPPNTTISLMYGFTMVVNEQLPFGEVNAFHIKLDGARARLGGYLYGDIIVAHAYADCGAVFKDSFDE